MDRADLTDFGYISVYQKGLYTLCPLFISAWRPLPVASDLRYCFVWAAYEVLLKSRYYLCKRPYRWAF
ncbi:hypothetical protein MBAV_005827 [Candidatus Magnetobacterium bavaricum]|uniref:Uncharacterized protein n=1 Tax=Candidatus Magnetobacterium bavaricum TaxID=29290 RepID=A0A0F3GJ72_9BACT|nr:hypothetical protein MBAV_005827 [Candidatus Magnetobacterium bavaricum]